MQEIQRKRSFFDKLVFEGGRRYNVVNDVVAAVDVVNVAVFVGDVVAVSVVVVVYDVVVVKVVAVVVVIVNDDVVDVAVANYVDVVVVVTKPPKLFTSQKAPQLKFDEI